MGDVDQLKYQETEHRDEITCLCEDGDCDADDYLFDRDGLQAHLDVVVLQRFGAHQSSMVMREQLGQQIGCLIANHLQLDL